jgi:uncharacterized membrane protein
MSPAVMVHIIWVLAVSGAIAGLLYFLVRRVPKLPDDVKMWILWGIIFFWVMFVIADLLVPLVDPGFKVFQ